MPNFLGSLRSGTGLGLAAASAGLSLPWSIGIGAFGAIPGLFEKDMEQVQAERRAQLQQEIGALYDRRLKRGTRLIGEQAAAASGIARTAAAARAMASGHASDAESYVATAEERALAAGANALRGFTEQTEEGRDRALEQIEFDWAGRPIQPGVSDTLATLGEGVSRFMQDRNYIKAIAGLSKNKSEVDTELNKVSETTRSVPKVSEQFIQEGGRSLGSVDDLELSDLPGLSVNNPSMLGPVAALRALRWRKGGSTF